MKNNKGLFPVRSKMSIFKEKYDLKEGDSFIRYPGSFRWEIVSFHEDYLKARFLSESGIEMKYEDLYDIKKVN